MITEDYVSFETAKLLKEKGFDGRVTNSYDNYTLEFLPHCAKHYGQTNAPTLQMAMKWLRDNYGFHIAVGPLSFEKLTGKAESYIFNYWFNGEYHIPYQEKHPEYHKLFAKTWEKYEEACEAAIKYCLENLI